MKQTIKRAILLVACGAFPAQAVQFNLDGMKELQQQGLKIAEQADNLKRLAITEKQEQLNKRRCLEVAGSAVKSDQGLKLAGCGEVVNQRWRLDEERRLVNSGGFCLDYKGDPAKPGTTLKTAKCSKDPRQTWSFDGQGRLQNHAKLCLDGAGKALVVKPCSEEAAQRWELID